MIFKVDSEEKLERFKTDLVKGRYSDDDLSKVRIQMPDWCGRYIRPMRTPKKRVMSYNAFLDHKPQTENENNRKTK